MIESILFGMLVGANILIAWNLMGIRAELRDIPKVRYGYFEIPEGKSPAEVIEGLQTAVLLFGKSR